MNATVIEVLEALHQAQQVPDPEVRVQAYQVSLAPLLHVELTAVVLVLTEGNGFGPDAARALAARL